VDVPRGSSRGARHQIDETLVGHRTVWCWGVAVGRGGREGMVVPQIFGSEVVGGGCTGW
jgi:hypothetical protein